MTAATLTLTDFLLARIAEDEAVARAASPGGWQYGDVDSVAGGSLYDETRMIASVHYEQPTDHDGTVVRHLLVPEADANGVHIARYDPARVLAECEAKRRIMEMHSSTTPVAKANTWSPGMCSGCNFDGYGDWASRDDECPTLRALAAVYADHPDYREEWRP